MEITYITYVCKSWIINKKPKQSWNWLWIENVVNAFINILPNELSNARFFNTKENKQRVNSFDDKISMVMKEKWIN